MTPLWAAQMHPIWQEKWRQISSVQGLERTKPSRLTSLDKDLVTQWVGADSDLDIKQIPMIWINQAGGQWPTQGKARTVTETVNKEKPSMNAQADKDIS